MFNHKTGALGPAFLTVHDSRLADIVQLYCEHVRPRFLKLHPDQKNELDANDGSLPFFLTSKGGKCTHMHGAFEWFKQEIIEAGLHTEEDLRYLNVRDFRSCISSWASDHKSEEVRLNAASLQNHSQRIHESTYRRNKIKQATGQSLALQQDLSAIVGLDTKLEVKWKNNCTNVDNAIECIMALD